MIPYLVYCAEQLRYESSPLSASSGAGEPSARPVLGLVRYTRNWRPWLTLCASGRAFSDVPGVLRRVNRAAVPRSSNTGPSAQQSFGGAR